MLPRTQPVLVLWHSLFLAASRTYSDRTILVFRIPSQNGLLAKAMHGEVCHLGQKSLSFLLSCLLHSIVFFPSLGPHGKCHFSIPRKTLALIKLITLFSISSEASNNNILLIHSMNIYIILCASPRISKLQLPVFISIKSYILCIIYLLFMATFMLQWQS